MPSADKAKLMMEQGQSFNVMAAMTDSGDNTTFSATSALPGFSRADGKEPVIAVNGVKSGGAITPNASNDQVDVAAIVCNLNGVIDATVSASTGESITRPASDVSKVNSVTITSAGAIAVIAGTDGATTAFSETRGAAGGPPFIPTDSIEVGQVRLTTSAAAAVDEAEIFQVINQHLEKADFPLYSVNYQDGDITFFDALPLIHTGSLPKAVYAEYYEPILVELPRSSDFKSAENTHTNASEQVYNETIASSSTSLGQGSFTQRLEDAVTDPVVVFKDQILWFKFFPDRNKTAYELVQGKLGIDRDWPAGGTITAACTISAETAGAQKAS